MTINNGYQFDDDAPLLNSDYAVQKVVDGTNENTWLNPVTVYVGGQAFHTSTSANTVYPTPPNKEDRFILYETLVDKYTEQIVDSMPCGSEDFVRCVMSLVKMHVRKSHDYGTKEDPFANITESARAVEIPTWKGARQRQHDKDFRIKRWLEVGTLANEGPKDAYFDKASYTLIEWCIHCTERGLNPLTGKE